MDQILDRMSILLMASPNILRTTKGMVKSSTVYSESTREVDMQMFNRDKMTVKTDMKYDASGMHRRSQPRESGASPHIATPTMLFRRICRYSLGLSSFWRLSYQTSLNDLAV